MNFKSNYATQIHVQTERKLTSNKADQMHFNLKKHSQVGSKFGSVQFQHNSNQTQANQVEGTAHYLIFQVQEEM